VIFLARIQEILSGEGVSSFRIPFTGSEVEIVSPDRRARGRRPWAGKSLNRVNLWLLMYPLDGK
jgi:hypothetical protein